MRKPAHNQTKHRNFLIGMLINSLVHLLFWGFALSQEPPHQNRYPVDSATLVFGEIIPLLILVPFLIYFVGRNPEAIKGLICGGLLTVLLMGGICFVGTGDATDLMSGLVFTLTLCTGGIGILIFLLGRYS
jgi:hypothetical protein